MYRYSPGGLSGSSSGNVGNQFGPKRVPDVFAGQQGTPVAQPGQPGLRQNPNPQNAQGLGPKGVQRMLAGNAKSMNPFLMQAIRDLMLRANTGMGQQQRNAFLAPRMENINRIENNTLAQAQQRLQDTGMMDSSHSAALQAGIMTNAGLARAGAQNELIQQDYADQQQAAEQLRAALMGIIQGGGGQAASIGLQRRQQELLAQQLAQSQPDLMAGLLGGIGSIAGTGAQLGLWGPRRVNP